MIFLSHNYKDKPIVELIADSLLKIYGTDKVFYDSWSIQPGDGIIDKMNEGLEEFKFFFLFVSKNSLLSDLVKLEWTNALYKATKEKLKFIPVRLDDCSLPAILSQLLYIDIFINGYQVALKQIVDIINGRNAFSKEDRLYENVCGYILPMSTDNEIHIEVRAEIYFEPISKYIILVENQENDFDVKCINRITRQNPILLKDIDVADNYKCNGVFFDINDSTVPGFPIKFIIKSEIKASLNFIGIMKCINENKIQTIPIIKL